MYFVLLKEGAHERYTRIWRCSMLRRFVSKLHNPWHSSIVSSDHILLPDEFIWAVGSICALNRIAFDPELILNQFPLPLSMDSLIRAIRHMGFKSKTLSRKPHQLKKLSFPCFALVSSSKAEEGNVSSIALLTDVTDERVMMFEANTNTPVQLSLEDFSKRYLGSVVLIAKEQESLSDPDAVKSQEKGHFGFSWFLPELFKYKKVWSDVLLASLVIQLLALGTPLFTQAIIDKVVVHRTESTLMVIAFGLCVFMIFSSILSWVRQYLVLHTGNRVDAVLAAGVFDHLFKLPPRYFENRPTGVIAARLHGVETIREFIASAAVSLVLDLPFLVIFIGIMFYYSVMLTLVTLAVLSVIALMSFFIAPIFQRQLNDQFLLGARNQAFLTEYIAGVETVKSLQMEPQLRSRFSDYLAEYLLATFKTKQLANTYNTIASFLEQFLTLLILVLGAYTVMKSTEFTIGMLVAFQMFSGKLSQPVMRLVGLWQQFQQASLSVKRLGDVMDAPTEPYTMQPSRLKEGKGAIEIDSLGFRYNEQLPFLYEDFSLNVQAGSTVVIMGPSGSGKSTFAKILQGFYQPNNGRIRIDGTDIKNFSANELRHYFGVVPQETVLFSGSIYDNLIAANPHATFEQIVQVCKLSEIHDTIEKLPQGYKTVIGERGAGLSGGQRQRLAIARALLKRPKILIFDEATSALDAGTAEHFAATVNQLHGKVTMLFITHALPKSLKVDHIIRIGDNTTIAPTKEIATA